MAMIECPECGKEISDKATNCPNCGCPIEKKASEPEKKNINTKLIIPIIAAVIVICACICIVINNSKKKAEAERKKNLYDSAISAIDAGEYSEAIEKLDELGEYEDSLNYKKYAEAMNKCLEGNYSGAYNDFSELDGFKDVEEVKNQLYYESRILGGFARDISDSEVAKKIKVKRVDVLVSSEEVINPRMVMVADYSGVETYFYWMLESDNASDYSLFGTCKSLNMEDYDDDADRGELFTAKIIASVLESDDIEIKNNLMNYDRINEVIQSGNYKTVKSID